MLSLPCSGCRFSNRRQRRLFELGKHKLIQHLNAYSCLLKKSLRHTSITVKEESSRSRQLHFLDIKVKLRHQGTNLLSSAPFASHSCIHTIITFARNPRCSQAAISKLRDRRSLPLHIAEYTVLKHIIRLIQPCQADC
ncbi:hypothetical protein D3C78_1165370 [compost metagenome]